MIHDPGHIYHLPGLFLFAASFQIDRDCGMSSTASTNSEEVKVLVSMGFPEQQAKIALLRANNEVNRAVEILSAGCEY